MVASSTLQNPQGALCVLSIQGGAAQVAITATASPGQAIQEFVVPDGMGPYLGGYFAFLGVQVYNSSAAAVLVTVGYTTPGFAFEEVYARSFAASEALATDVSLPFTGTGLLEAGTYSLQIYAATAGAVQVLTQGAYWAVVVPGVV